MISNLVAGAVEPSAHRATGLVDIDGNELFEGDEVVNLNAYGEVGIVLWYEFRYTEDGVDIVKDYWSACGTGIGGGISSNPRCGMHLLRRAEEVERDAKDAKRS